MARQHRIAEIEDLPEEAKTKLAAAGLNTVEQLLERASASGMRAALAKEIGSPVSEVTEWVNRADLMRIKGVGREFADLLENAGVDSCRELQHRVPENLHARMVESNASGQFTKRTPTLSQVADWIAQAKEITAAAGV